MCSPYWTSLWPFTLPHMPHGHNTTSTAVLCGVKQCPPTLLPTFIIATLAQYIISHQCYGLWLTHTMEPPSFKHFKSTSLWLAVKLKKLPAYILCLYQKTRHSHKNVRVFFWWFGEATCLCPVWAWWCLEEPNCIQICQHMWSGNSGSSVHHIASIYLCTGLMLNLSRQVLGYLLCWSQHKGDYQCGPDQYCPFPRNRQVRESHNWFVGYVGGVWSGCLCSIMRMSWPSIFTFITPLLSQ